MKEFFKEMLEYSHKTNLKFIAVFETVSESQDEKAMKLMSHILNAQHVWNSRIEGKQPLFATWDQHPVAKFGQIENANYLQSQDITDNFDFNKVISYKTFAGKPFENTIRDVLFQVINHSTYHRAQINTIWKQRGAEPVASDYIFWKR